jgi:methyl-accepting chemotaxis protein
MSFLHSNIKARVFGGFNSVAGSIASAARQQGDATQEITQNVQQALKGGREVTHNMNEVLAAARDSSAASRRTPSPANELSKQATDLSVEVDNFLRSIRANEEVDRFGSAYCVTELFCKQTGSGAP